MLKYMSVEYLSSYLLILATPSRAFLTGTVRQGYEKEKQIKRRMIVSLIQGLKPRSMKRER